jgi:UDPglucose--hexose-1-phosphate uridylyltransferase
MQASEIRLNKITREWVIYSPSRRKRPQDFQKISRAKELLPDTEKNVPFVPVMNTCRTRLFWRC